MNDFDLDDHWHSDGPPSHRTLILACLGSAFVTASIIGILLKLWGE